MKWTASDGCTFDSVMGRKRDRVCPHGLPFLSESQLGYGKHLSASEDGDKSSITSIAKPRRRSIKRSEPKRDWTLARQKLEEEGRCRVCNSTETFGLECAHILGRKYDQPISPGSRTLLVLPDRIVPLCGERARRCHQRFDAHELDLLPYLTAAEQAQAVLDAGSMGLALKRISPGLEMVA